MFGVLTLSFFVIRTSILFVSHSRVWVESVVECLCTLILKGWVNAFKSNKMDNRQETEMVNNGERSSFEGQEADVVDFNGGPVLELLVARLRAALGFILIATVSCCFQTTLCFSTFGVCVCAHCARCSALLN